MTCGSNFNMRWIAKAMKDALEATGYYELRDYQRKTIEAYLSGKDGEGWGGWMGTGGRTD